MRLPTIPPDQLRDDQRPLFDQLHASIKAYLQAFVTHKPDGTLIGPFNALLHFPSLGAAAWQMSLALNKETTLPTPASEIAILATGARYSCAYELYSHENLAPARGLAAAKIATIAAGQRPSDLTTDEGIAYDIAAVLNRGAQILESTYQASVKAFGQRGTAELVYLVGCYGVICLLLNAYDIDIPRTEGA